MSDEKISDFGLALGMYRELEHTLKFLRELNGGKGSPEEDRCLDQMEKVWHELTDAEQAELRAEGARCWQAEG